MRLLLFALVALLLSAQPKETILEETLYAQNAPETPDGIRVMWIPAPLERTCENKRTQRCAEIDYCIRTTTKNTATCRNVGVDLAKLPAYPRDLRPRRVLSVTYFPAAPITGLDKLRTYVASKPKSTFDTLTAATKFKAKIKFKHKADDDDFELLEVLSVP